MNNDNLKKLATSNILYDFVRKHNGEWDHRAWLDLCHTLDENGNALIDVDQVGLLLEDERAAYFNRKNDVKPADDGQK